MMIYAVGYVVYAFSDGRQRRDISSEPVFV